MSDNLIGIVVPAMALVFSVMALGLWLRDRSDGYLIGYIVGPLTMGLSLSIDHFAIDQQSTLVRMSEHVLTIFACGALAWAACERAGRPAPLKAWMVIGIIGLIADMIAILNDAFVANLLILNSVCGIYFVMAAQLLTQSSRRTFVDRALLAVFILAAAQFFLRPTAVIVMLDASMTASSYRQSAGHSLLIVTSILLMLLLALSIMGTILYDRFTKAHDTATLDPLTGLPGRRAFESAVYPKMADAEQQGLSLSLIVVDIDEFKQVNDRWGHQAGDRAIASLGMLLKQNVRSNDLVGRIGGEEFCIAIWDCSNEPAARLAERIRKSFENLQHPDIGAELNLTVSLGLATARKGEPYEGLFARADKALFVAKDRGRNRVENAEALFARDQAKPSDIPLRVVSRS